MALEVRTGRLSAPQRVDAPSGVRGSPDVSIQVCKRLLLPQ